MRFVRCEACGAKALVAASQCPRCSHPLELRDDNGNEVPLAHCRGCDTYYPRRRGACRWCGPTARGPRPSPFVWTGLTIVVVTGTAFGGWMFRGRASTRPEASPRSLAAARASIAPAARALDSTVTPNAAPAAKPAEPIATLAQVTSIPSASAATLPTTASPDSTAEWVDKTVHTWVNVRTDASREAQVVGVISPDTHVQVGASHAGWVRIKAPGLSGWVGRRALLTDSSSSPR
jgi:SH3 domain-containing protein